MLHMVALTVFGQTENKFYIKIKGGYNFATSSSVDNRLYMDFNRTDFPTSSEISNAKIGLGKGFDFGLNAGYSFNKYLGTELGINYFIGGESSTKSTYGAQYSKYIISAKTISVNPSLVFRADFTKINPYIKLGFVFGKSTFNQDWDLLGVAGDPNQKLDATKKFSGGISWGYNGSFGINYSLTSKMSLFGEAILNKVSYSPKKSSYIKYNVNGVDLLPTLNLKDRETEYVSSYTEDYTLPPSITNNQTKKETSFQVDLSNIGLNFGLIYYL